MPRTGRPKKPTARRLGLFIRLTEAELAAIKRAARLAAVPLSEYARHRLCFSAPAGAKHIDIGKSPLRPTVSRPVPPTTESNVAEVGTIRRGARKLKPRPAVTPAVSADPPVERPLVPVEAVPAEPDSTEPAAERFIHRTRDVNGVELSLSDGSGLARLLSNHGWITLRYKTSAPDRVTGLAPAKLRDIVSRVLHANARNAPAELVAAQLEARLQEAIKAKPPAR